MNYGNSTNHTLSVVSTNEATIRFLTQLGADAFWGTVTLRFEAGKVVHVRKEENLKPTELPGNPESEHARTQP